MMTGQNSSSGRWPARSPQVLPKMSLVISIAMSQRMPSHWSAMSDSVWAVAAGPRPAYAFSCTTSGQGGKYGSRPCASTYPPTGSQPAGSALTSSSSPWMKTPGAR